MALGSGISATGMSASEMRTYVLVKFSCRRPSTRFFISLYSHKAIEFRELWGLVYDALVLLPV